MPKIHNNVLRLHREPDFGVKWPKLNEVSEKLHYMHIAGPSDIRMEINDNLAENRFWNQLLGFESYNA